MKGFRIDEGQRAGTKMYLLFSHPENNFTGIDGADAETLVHMRFEQPGAVLGIAPLGKRQAAVLEKILLVHGRLIRWET